MKKWHWQDNFDRSRKRKRTCKNRGSKVINFGSYIAAARHGILPGEEFYVALYDHKGSRWANKVTMPFHPFKPMFRNGTFTKKQLTAIQAYWRLTNTNIKIRDERKSDWIRWRIRG